jgi:hypothetical protein
MRTPITIIAEEYIWTTKEDFDIWFTNYSFELVKYEKDFFYKLIELTKENMEISNEDIYLKFIE